MINAIGAMHAVMRSKKRPDDKTFDVEIKKRRRRPTDDASERPERAQSDERGATA